MKSKHIILFFNILSLLLAISCTKKPVSPAASAYPDIHAATTPYGKGTKGEAKTTLQDHMPLWKTGDCFCFWDARQTPVRYQTTHGDTAVALFKTTARPTDTVRSPHCAVYPADLYRSPARIFLPPSQISTSGGLADAPMYATSNTADLTFTNLCSVIRIRVTGEYAKSLFYVVLLADRPINGEFDLVDNPENPACPTLTHSHGGGNNTILNVTNAAEGNGYYHIYLPPGTYSTLSAYLITTDRKRCAAPLIQDGPVTLLPNTITQYVLIKPDFQ